MATLVFSLLTNFHKSFDNGIILVVIWSMIPILLLGMTGIADEAFAQNQKAPSVLTPVYIGTTDLSNLTEMMMIETEMMMIETEMMMTMMIDVQ